MRRQHPQTISKPRSTVEELPPFKHKYAESGRLRWDLQDDGDRKAGWRFVVLSKVPISADMEGFDQVKKDQLWKAARSYADRIDRILVGVELMWINDAHRT